MIALTDTSWCPRGSRGTAHTLLDRTGQNRMTYLVMFTQYVVYWTKQDDLPGSSDIAKV